MDLFESSSSLEHIGQPLADRLRPTSIDEVVGQEHLLGPNKALRRLLENDRIPSMVLWGPPGSGKTTLARLIAQHTKHHFVEFSAVMSGISDIKQSVEQAKVRRGMYQRGTIVFIDEIHRFNKTQQDALLPHIENGTLVLIGATTENPSFSINRALLSRSRTFILEPLEQSDLMHVFHRAIAFLSSTDNKVINMSDDAITYLIASSDGDARQLLTSIETLVKGMPKDDTSVLTKDEIIDILQVKSLPYDRNGEAHYTIMSALHKSIRDSDPDASIYWLARMLESGEDPMYITRRLVRTAAEDIGLAEPQALVVANAVMQSTEKIGMPECTVLLGELVIYLALCPKSNSAYLAYNNAKEAVLLSSNEPVPLHLRNASTDFLRSAGYGKGYKYAHDYKDAQVTQQHLPKSLAGKSFYMPTDRDRNTKSESETKDRK